jgi:hypothetical protein
VGLVLGSRAVPGKEPLPPIQFGGPYVCADGSAFVLERCEDRLKAVAPRLAPLVPYLAGVSVEPAELVLPFVPVGAKGPGQCFLLSFADLESACSNPRRLVISDSQMRPGRTCVL